MTLTPTNPPNQPNPGQHRTPLRLIDASFAGQGALGTAVSAAILRRVARREILSTARIHRTGPILAFGRIDRLSPGYPRAIATAEELGYEPVERIAGGRAAVFHEGTLAFSRATPERDSFVGTHPRYAAMAELLAVALRTVGLDARVGEVPGEYCPGTYSVNARGAVKIAGLGQRVIAGGAHVGGVIVIGGEDRIRAVLIPVYEALGLNWEPETAGSVATELGVGEDGIEELTAAVRDAFVAGLAAEHLIEPAELDEATLAMAAKLGRDHATPSSAPRPG